MLGEENTTVEQLLVKVHDSLGRVRRRLQRSGADGDESAQPGFRLQRLLELSMAMASARDLQRVLDMAVVTLIELFGAEHGFLISVEGDGELSFNVAVNAYGEPIDDATSEVSRGVVEEVLRTGEAVYVGNALDDERFRSRASVRELELHSALCAPLLGRDGTIGVVYIDHRAAAARFERRDLDLLKLFANQAGIAIENARLFHALRRTTDQLRQTRELVQREERLRALGTMAAGVAHNINNSLQPILGFTQVLLEKGCWDEATRSHLRDIAQSTLDIASTVKRLREFYRKRTGEEKPRPVKVEKVIEDALALTRPRWWDMPRDLGIVIHVRKDIPGDLRPVWGIESELREALVNEIMNAVDAMPEGGELRLHARAEREWLVLELSDTGVGMSAEVRAHCFEPFYTTKGTNGTGMGLSTVYGTICRHGGELEVDSQPGKGTRLIHRLPLAPATADSTPPETLARVGARILCADGDEEVRRFVGRSLTLQGHSVHLSSTDREALAALEQERFDLVLAATDLPDDGGQAFAAQVRARFPGTKVIFFAGSTECVGGDGNDETRADLVLRKPLRLPELSAAVTGTLAAGTKPG